MKNIHILPTDKPSRLYLHSNNELQLITNIIQNIYITNDEEIKEGDYMFDVSEMTVYECIGQGVSGYKIILTTDQDLIKDGVQVIDDEFLEWFVKNPSCEEVKVKRGFADGTDYGYNFLDYKIIIPQEEPKQEMPIINGSYGCIIETNKQEMIEEAAEIIVTECYGSGGGEREMKKCFIMGAKWQQERSYSEEDLREAFNQGQENIDYHEIHGFSAKLTINEWLEKFKKK